MIHCLDGFDYSTGYEKEFVILRQIINFAVATFIFMAGYFVNVGTLSDKEFSYKNWVVRRGTRLGVPFVIWSLLYSGLSLLKNIHNNNRIDWIGFLYRFVIGKSATPFYYIIVLMQLTVITPWLVKTVKQNNKFGKVLWLVTPVYLVYVYIWTFIVGIQPRLYETFFPAWFGFYYLGIQARCGHRVKCNGYAVIGMFLLSCVEAFGMQRLGFALGFCTSQITIGSFLYSVTIIGWILKKNENGNKRNRLLSKVGDCSYGIFFIHMIILMLVGRLIEFSNWYTYWILRFTLTILISFFIVYVSQKVLRYHKKVLLNIGFI